MKNDGKFKKHSIPWNKGKTGYMGANRTSFKKGDNAVPLNVKLMAKIQKSANCWKWTGHKNNKGYGVINLHLAGGVKLAHRIMYEYQYGPIPKGKNILHTCDNTACVRPSHLFVGTQQDNMRDMAKKGRWGNQFTKNI